MKPKRIILIRHGESEGNVDQGIYEHKPDYALLITETGKLQAEEAGKTLRSILGDETVFFYLSPMWRTRMTFENIVSKFDQAKIKWKEEPRLREQEWGHFKSIKTGLQIEKLRDQFGPFYYRIPDGESAADVYDRVSDFFGTMYRDFAKEDFPENVVIVTHGMTIRLFLMRWFHWTVEEFERHKNLNNCQIVTLEKQQSGKYSFTDDLPKDNPKHSFQRPLQYPSISNLFVNEQD